MAATYYQRREFLKMLSLGLVSLSLPQFPKMAHGAQNNQPNFLIIFADDLGYGDLGVFGNPTIKTPNLDRMAMEGQKWTNFYAAASVCTPSRAGIMTGRLPIRSGMCSDKSRVLFPNSLEGLPASEVTLAEALKPRGYATACIGKWHLGYQKQYLPTSNGFDYYFGIPYSNDMDRVAKGGRELFWDPKVAYWNVPLMRNEEIIERPANQHTLVKRYTEQTISFIKQHKEEPFFVYLAHNMPHVPLFASDKFDNTSARGLFGDVVEEIDWGVGQILQMLEDEGLDKNTLVVFTSDNGPWLSYEIQGGSAGLLKDGKGTTWEGGMREPTIFRWPGKIEPGVVTGIGSTMDLYSTFCHLAGAKVPDDRIMDSEDLSPTLFENKPSPRDVMFYYRGRRLYAVRKGAYKAHFITKSAYKPNLTDEFHDPPLLFNLDHDPGEHFDIADQHPEVIEEIEQIVSQHKANLVPGRDRLAKRE